MKVPLRLIALVAFASIATAGRAPAAGNKTAPPSGSMASFTASQAYAGRFAFIENCAECHGANLGGQFGPALAGPHSNIPWQTPMAVYTYMTQQMPVGNAGGLSRQDYLNIEAFILQSNGRRPGRAALTLAAIQRDPLHLDGSR